MGIKYSKLVELIKEEEQRLSNASPTKVLPPRPSLNEKKEEERDIV